MHDDLRSAVAADMPRLKQTLADLVRFPSVSAPGFDKEEVRKAADHIVGLLDEAGFDNTQLLEIPGGNPAVFGEIAAPDGAPTLLLYAHYDVQPPGPSDEWETDPFEPVERNGRLYGRGTSDDKVGVVMHLGAVAAHGGDLPVGVQMFFEGEEEAGSESLEGILEKYADLIKADANCDWRRWKLGSWCPRVFEIAARSGRGQARGQDARLGSSLRLIWRSRSRRPDDTLASSCFPSR